VQIIKIFIFLTISIIFSVHLNAQRGNEFGGHIGTSIYFGDLNTNYNLSNQGLSFGLLARRNLNERISLAAGLQYGKISATDAKSNNYFQNTRNLSFQSHVYDLNFTLEFNFFQYIHGSDDYYYTPYIFGGFSILKFNPQAELDGQTYSLRDFGTEGQQNGQEYGLMTAGFVYGFGFKWDINRDWSLNASLSGRNLFSDYIDDVSGEYPDFATLQARRGITAVQLSNKSTDPDFARPTMQRGNGKNNDVIYFFNIGIMRYFGELPCPSISKNFY
jgi:hypothetical protein